MSDLWSFLSFFLYFLFFNFYNFSKFFFDFFFWYFYEFFRILKLQKIKVITINGQIWFDHQSTTANQSQQVNDWPGQTGRARISDPETDKHADPPMGKMPLFHKAYVRPVFSVFSYLYFSCVYLLLFSLLVFFLYLHISTSSRVSSVLFSWAPELDCSWLWKDFSCVCLQYGGWSLVRVIKEIIKLKRG